MTLGFVLTGRDIAEAGAPMAGGKAYALARSQAAGLRVPAFFVVLPEAATAAGALRLDAARDIEAALARLADQGHWRFAVRSSARSEDGETNSHAGQFLTLLNVPRAEVPDAIVRVIRSGLEAGVTDYRTVRGLGGTELPAALVQAMVEASAAGVCFGADPVGGRRDQIVIAAVAGLGDRLVAGEETGESWRLDKASLDILERPEPALLTDDQARQVARLGLAAEARKGWPQDIEWVFGSTDGLLYHVQDRPITTRLAPAWVPETALTVLDNSNIVESYPGLVSPLTFSFAALAYDRVYRAFLRMVGVPQDTIDAHAGDLAGMLTLVDGRIYYNLGSWYRLLALLPLFGQNRSSMETMMGVSEPLPDEAMAKVRPPGALAGLRMLAGLSMQALLLARTKARFLKRLALSLPPGRDATDLADKPLSALAAEYRRIEAALLDQWDAPLVNDFLCMMAYGGSRRLMERWAGPEGLVLHNEIMIGQGDILSAEPAKLIRAAGLALAGAGPGLGAEIASGGHAAAFDHPVLGPMLRDYVERFGDRRVGELKLESPTLSDDPAPLLSAVLAASRREAQASETETRSGATLAAVFAGRPARRLVAGALLSYSKARVRDRENLRFERTRVFGRARRVFLAMGTALAATGRLARPEDIFDLTVGEVLGAAEGHGVTHDLRALAALRQAERARDAALPDPPERILLRGAAGDRQARLAGQNAPRTVAAEGVNERRGLACGSGRASGRARIILDPLTDQVQPGEVLVARHTDPGWIQHFVNAAAVVVERGSVLSHSAIVSRELGIPCVVALAGACAWLKNGDVVDVDGSSGTVRRLDG